MTLLFQLQHCSGCSVQIRCFVHVGRGSFVKKSWPNVLFCPTFSTALMQMTSYAKVNQSKIVFMPNQVGRFDVSVTYVLIVQEPNGLKQLYGHLQQLGSVKSGCWTKLKIVKIASRHILHDNDQLLRWTRALKIIIPQTHNVIF